MVNNFKAKLCWWMLMILSLQNVNAQKYKGKFLRINGETGGFDFKIVPKESKIYFTIDYKDNQILIFKFELQRKNLTVEVKELIENTSPLITRANIKFNSKDSLKFINNLRINDTSDLASSNFLFSIEDTTFNSVKLYTYTSRNDNTIYYFNDIDSGEWEDHILAVRDFYKAKSKKIQLMDSVGLARKNLAVRKVKDSLDGLALAMMSKQDEIIAKNKRDIHLADASDINYDTTENYFINFMKGVIDKYVGYNKRLHFTYDVKFGIDTSGKIINLFFNDRFGEKYPPQLIKNLNDEQDKLLRKKDVFFIGKDEIPNPNLYADLKNKFNNSLPPLGLIETDFPNEYLSGWKRKFSRYERVSIKVQRNYNFGIEVMIDSNTGKWKFKHSGIKYKMSGDSINTKKHNSDFLSAAKKDHGIYIINIGRATIKTEAKERLIDTVTIIKQKYKYYTFIGASVTTLLSYDLSDIIPANTLFKGNSNGLDFFIIRHHFGVFFGSHNSDNNLVNKDSLVQQRNGKYLIGTEKYYNGGIYFSPFYNSNLQFFYLKAGYVYEQSHIQEYAGDKPIISTPDKKSMPLLLGFSVIIPILQFEAGYNFVMKSSFFNIGLNIPLNR